MGLNGSPTVGLHDTLQDWGQGTSFQSGGMGAAATQNDATWLYTFYNPLDPTSSNRVPDARRQFQLDGLTLRRS